MGRRIVEYSVTLQLSAPDLVESVAGYIRNGWEPLGGVAHTNIGNGLYGFTQAMVRYEQIEGKIP
jgi:hypothetical protein